MPCLALKSCKPISKRVKENQTGMDINIPGMENAIRTADKMMKAILVLFFIVIRGFVPSFQRYISDRLCINGCKREWQYFFHQCPLYLVKIPVENRIVFGKRAVSVWEKNNSDNRCPFPLVFLKRCHGGFPYPE